MKNIGWLHISEHLELEYLKANDKFNITDFLNKKVFRVSDTPLSYRQVNSLDKDGLLGEQSERKKGWREFSPKELVYIQIVTELKELGFEHRKLDNLWRAFFKEPNKPPKGEKMPSPHINRGISETALGCVFAQVEMTLVVNKKGEFAFFDPGNFAVYDRLLGALPSVYIRLNLNDFVNDVLKMMKKEPFPVKWSLSEEYIQSSVLNLTEKEKGILEVIRNNDFQTVKLKKKNGEVSVIHAERSNGDDISVQDLVKILKEKDYQDINIVKRDGKLVNLKQEEIIKL